MDIHFFYLVALVAVVSALLVVTCKNPINSALALVNTFFSLAIFYVMLHAPFMAAIQVMVYAGAIMVLIIFVIMLLNLGTATQKKVKHAVAGSAALAALLGLLVTYFLKRSEPTGMTGDITSEVVAKIGHTELIGKALFVDFLLPFEITSVLLLVAIIGAVVLAKREV
jgi:NADH-quinone oxidoreductase subunit J